MLPFIITGFVALAAILLFYLGRHQNDGNLRFVGFSVGALNVPLLAYLIRGLLALTIALGALAYSHETSSAYNTTTSFRGECGYQSGPGECAVSIALRGGSDFYDCYRIRLYKTNGAYNVVSGCRGLGMFTTWFYVPPGQTVDYIEVSTYDGIWQPYTAWHQYS